MGTNKVYNGTTAATIDATGATLSGVVPGDTVAISTAGVVANYASKNVGTGVSVTYTGLALSGADAGNYTLTNPAITGEIRQAALLASGITAANKAYDGTTAATIDAFGASLSGAVRGDDITLNTAGAVGTFDTKNAGTGKVVNVTGLALAGSDDQLPEPHVPVGVDQPGDTHRLGDHGERQGLRRQDHGHDRYLRRGTGRARGRLGRDRRGLGDRLLLHEERRQRPAGDGQRPAPDRARRDQLRDRHDGATITRATSRSRA
ncbi:MAG: YDG domain-containing protein [Isosphaeraceae bacterium]